MSEDKIHLFGDFALDLDRGFLLRKVEPVHLRRQAYEVLKYLALNAGRLIGKDRLIEEIWEGRAVTDGSLGKCIEEVRQALGKESWKHLRTVRGRGYIFEAETDFGEALRVDEPPTEATGPQDTSGGGGEAGSTEEPKFGVPGAGFRPRAGQRSKTALLAAGVLLASLSAVLAFYFDRSAPKDPATSRRLESLAVLPFKPLVPETRDEMLEMGMADSLISKLSSVRELVVRPIAASRRYADLEADPVQAGRELRVDAVLDGTIQRDAGRIRVNARLMRVADGRQLWTNRFDEEVGDIFAVQDSISERVAGELALKLTGRQRELLNRRHTLNIEAYQLYLWGRYHWHKTAPEDHWKSGDYFKRAIELDPAYAPAYAGLADFYGRGVSLGLMSPIEHWPLMEEATMKALELDPYMAEVYNALAGLRLYYHRDWEGGVRAFERAKELNPGFAEAHHHYGTFSWLMGWNDRSIAEIRHALELDPFSPRFNRNLGRALHLAGRDGESVEQLLRALELDPNDPLAHECLALTYERMEMYPEAAAAWRDALALSGAAELASIFERANERREYEAAVRAVSRKQLEGLRERDRRGEYVPAMHFVRGHVRAGEYEQGLEWLERAIGERNRLVLEIGVDPVYFGLRSDPRSNEILGRLNLP
jgi:TolB-like protein/DNA-binding winged helix-turn-helix (wHTH) protein/Tfp pilus assembly protein PilF